MAIQFGPRLKAFTDEALPIVLGTVRRDGSVQMNPLWYEYRDGQIWLTGGEKRGWFTHVRRDPRVTLLLLDPRNMSPMARASSSCGAKKPAAWRACAAPRENSLTALQG